MPLFLPSAPGAFVGTLVVMLPASVLAILPQVFPVIRAVFMPVLAPAVEARAAASVIQHPLAIGVVKSLSVQRMKII